MLSRFSSPRRSSVSLQLLRHFSNRVSPLKKQSLFSQKLHGNGPPKLTKFTQKGSSNSAKATQQDEASLRSVYQHSPLGVSVELPVLENGRQQEQRLVEDDACIAKLSMRSKKESKEAQQSDGSTKLSARSLKEGIKAHRNVGDTQPSMRALIGSKRGTHGDTQPSMRAQIGGKRGSYGDAKLFQRESRKVDPAQFSLQSQIAGEEGHHSHGPVESKPGKRLALQTRRASQKPRPPISKLGTSPLRKGSSKQIPSLVSQTGDEPGKSEENDEQNASKHTLSLKKSVPSVGREVKNFLDIHSVTKKGRITDRFLHDLQRKIELVSVESAPPSHVKILLRKKAFLNEPPEKLAEVLTVLKLFFESGDKACEILTANAGIIAQPLEQLHQRLQVLVEFEVDKAACCRLGTSLYMLTLEVEHYRSVLSFLKELGLSAESRNRMIYKCPRLMRTSVENRMQPNVNFLESIETAKPTLLKLLESRPITLCSPVDQYLMVMHKLCQHVGLSANEFVRALRNMCQYSSRNYFLRYNFFKEQGFSDEAFAGMIKRHPNILGVSNEAIKAKLHFLLHTAKRDISEVAVFPGYFNFSLASRIIPRFKILEELNLPTRLTLAKILNCTKSAFMAKLKKSGSSKRI